MLKNKSIRTKLISVILLTSGFVLLLKSVAYWLYQYYNFKANVRERLISTSRLIAANSTAALAFNDAMGAAEVLESLEVESNVICAVLYDSSNVPFSKYCRDSQLTLPEIPASDGVSFEGSEIISYTPVIHQGKRLGTLFLAADTTAVYKTLLLHSIIAAFIVVICLLIAFFLSKIFQRNLADPILDLESTARNIFENADYSIRAKKHENDEVGKLTDAFNLMLTRIEKQSVEIRELNQGLEMKVQERTHELETAYNEMEAFSYIVSHDLSAPLRRIEMYVSMLHSRFNDETDENDRKTLAVVSKNAAKMRNLIGDLLSFSQLGRTELIKEKTSMQKIVQEQLDDFLKAETNQNIHVDIGELPEINADKATISQVWNNLLGNAVKYSRGKNPVVIKIGSKSTDREIAYFVQDNGVGFDMAYYDQLFKPFKRLHHQSEFDGTGVGLAIVDRIVTKHGGRIWAESRLGEGSIFYFSLPK